MNKFFRLFFLITGVAFLTNCDGDDTPGPAPLRDYEEVYGEDLIDIEKYLKTHSISVIDNPGAADDQSVTFTEVPDGDPTSIWFDPRLTHREVEWHDITYKLYYLPLREGGLPDKSTHPTNVDAVLASYEGSYLFHYDDPETTGNDDILKTFEFESVPFPQQNILLEGVIKGWSEIFPQFGPGTSTDIEGQPTVYNDFGAGIMFIPSGLGYFGQSQTAIPQYSPLIFTFKLYEMTRLDQDGDGILSYLEDLDHDRYMRVIEEGTVNPDDTDADLAPDYLDLDDDGDFFLTKVETRRPAPAGATTFTNYPFNGAAVDDPLTTDIDETQGIPSCSGDFTTATRLRKHRDASCH